MCVYIAQQPMKYRQAIHLPEILSTVNILSLTY